MAALRRRAAAARACTAPAEWARRARARTPLRVRLVAVLLLLVAVALVGSGIAAVTTLRSYLVQRVDSQLSDVVPLVEASLDGTLRSPVPGDRGGPFGGPPSGTAGRQSRLPNAYVVEVTGPSGHVVSGPTGVLVESGQPLPALPRLTGEQTTARGRHSFTVHATSGGTQWRVLAVPVTLPDGTSGALQIAQSLSDVQNTTDHLITLLAIIGGAAVVVLGGAGYLIVRRSLRPLRDVERAAAQIAAGDLSHRVPETADRRTEVGGLSVALNTMLGQIETAFAERAASEEAARGSEQRMRRFVADASHELRTPLTTIRGFAELYRHGAVSDDAELERLMRRIEDAARSMGLLVEDLLTLARLDQQRPLEREPVDLLFVARDAVTDARAVDPARELALAVGPLDPPPVVIGDQARLRQVLANLLGNALRHTPAGTSVTVRVRTEPASGSVPPAGSGRGSVRLSVEDEGPGMTEQDAGRVFERFYRADAARNRGDGGTGLGLSIVAALVAAHEGTVRVETAPGAGARFHIELPLAPAGELPAGD